MERGAGDFGASANSRSRKGGCWQRAPANYSPEPARGADCFLPAIMARGIMRWARRPQLVAGSAWGQQKGLCNWGEGTRGAQVLPRALGPSRSPFSLRKCLSCQGQQLRANGDWGLLPWLPAAPPPWLMGCPALPCWHFRSLPKLLQDLQPLHQAGRWLLQPRELPLLPQGAGERGRADGQRDGRLGQRGGLRVHAGRPLQRPAGPAAGQSPGQESEPGAGLLARGVRDLPEDRGQQIFWPWDHGGHSHQHAQHGDRVPRAGECCPGTSQCSGDAGGVMGPNLAASGMVWGQEVL